ncbi:MAG: tetratricopeptide repeat protein [Thermodesulfobacteriota bacterium]
MVEKKISRKELLKSPDEFLTFSEKVFNYVSEHSKQFLTGVVAAVAVILFLVVLNWYRDYSAGQAAQAYNGASGGLETKTNPDPEKAKSIAAALEAFLAEYPGSDPARLALLDLGSLYYRLGQYDKSLEYYRRFLDSLRKEEESLRPLVLDSMAYAYESMGKLEEAVQTWEKVLALPGDLMKEEAQMGLGRVNLVLGRKDRSQAAYQTVIQKYPDSPQASLARVKLAEMGK